MRTCSILLPIFVLSACGQATDAVNSDATPAKVQVETATYFSTSPGNVRVGAFEQTLLGTKYKANVGGRSYDCHYIRSAVTCQNA
ncbi:MAG: hypothetical protein AAF222_05925 [Pseudomonadota bacterium]